MLLFPVLRGEERRGEEEGRERERGREGAGEGSWNIALFYMLSMHSTMSYIPSPCCGISM
jgi:hypothetical protein